MTEDIKDTNGETALLVDTETTGGDTPAPVEVGWLRPLIAELGGDVSVWSKQLPVGVKRFCDGGMMTLGAVATHHILPNELWDAPAPPEIPWTPEPTDYMIGHNVDYDWKVLGEPDVRRIDTLALARAAWPDLDSHTQTALLYHIEGMSSLTREKAKGAHGAKEDVLICWEVFKEAVEALNNGEVPGTWEDIWRMSEDARIPRFMPFGKHKGAAIGDLPPDYVRWLRKQPDMDPYIVMALDRADNMRARRRLWAGEP